MFHSCSLLLGSILYTTLDKIGLPSSCTRFPKQYIFEWKRQPHPACYLIASAKTANAYVCHPASVGKKKKAELALLTVGTSSGKCEKEDFLQKGLLTLEYSFLNMHQSISLASFPALLLLVEMRSYWIYYKEGGGLPPCVVFKAV